MFHSLIEAHPQNEAQHLFGKVRRSQFLANSVEIIEIIVLELLNLHSWFRVKEIIVFLREKMFFLFFNFWQLTSITTSSRKLHFMFVVKKMQCWGLIFNLKDILNKLLVWSLWDHSKYDLVNDFFLIPNYLSGSNSFASKTVPLCLVVLLPSLFAAWLLAVLTIHIVYKFLWKKDTVWTK